MDLIYMNTAREDVNVLTGYSLDLAFGNDENNFECTIASDNHCCAHNYFLYIEGTEYGGIIDSIKVDTDREEITYSGRTWHGILDTKVIEPDGDYLVVSGEANNVLAELLELMGLTELFRASSEASGIEIKNYKMNRYITGYAGIRKMLKAFGAKLNISFIKGMVELSAVPFVDYSASEIDDDYIDFVIKKNQNPINHVICLGKGELSEREVHHIYADENGNISETQVFTGLSEVTAVYENTFAESTEELIQGGANVISESWNSDEVSVDFNTDSLTYDIGDIVGARELITGISVASEVTKKIIKIKDSQISIEYKVGE